MVLFAPTVVIVKRVSLLRFPVNEEGFAPPVMAKG
jgi:hypothetical protein